MTPGANTYSTDVVFSRERGITVRLERFLNINDQFFALYFDRPNGMYTVKSIPKSSRDLHRVHYTRFDTVCVGDASTVEQAGNRACRAMGKNR